MFLFHKVFSLSALLTHRATFCESSCKPSRHTTYYYYTPSMHLVLPSLQMYHLFPLLLCSLTAGFPITLKLPFFSIPFYFIRATSNSLASNACSPSPLSQAHNLRVIHPSSCLQHHFCTNALCSACYSI